MSHRFYRFIQQGRPLLTAQGRADLTRIKAVQSWLDEQILSPSANRQFAISGNGVSCIITTGAKEGEEAKLYRDKDDTNPFAILLIVHDKKGRITSAALSWAPKPR